jgi:intracellular multiplication protein IcmO
MSGAGSGLLVPDIFRVRAAVFIDGLLRVLRWAETNKGISLDVRQIRAALPFIAVGAIVQRRLLPTPQGPGVVLLEITDIPDDVLAPLRAYLCETADFEMDCAFDEQSSPVPREQHGHVVRALNPDLASYLL